MRNVFSEENLASVFEPIGRLPFFYTNTKWVTEYLSKELVACILKTQISNGVFIDDGAMCQVLDFFDGKG
jgi:hypothetical protein